MCRGLPHSVCCRCGRMKWRWSKGEDVACKIASYPTTTCNSCLACASLPLFVRSVELSYNRIAALPREVYDLKELEELYINHNVMRYKERTIG